MNRDEALKICRLAKAASPAQAVDEYTPDLWVLALQRDLYADAEQAVMELVREQEWMHLSHITKRMARIRMRRLEAFGVEPDPPASLDPSDTAAYHAWILSTRRAIADGKLTPPDVPAALPHAESKAATAAVKTLRQKWTSNVREGLDV